MWFVLASSLQAINLFGYSLWPPEGSKHLFLYTPNNQKLELDLVLEDFYYEINNHTNTYRPIYNKDIKLWNKHDFKNQLIIMK